MKKVCLMSILLFVLFLPITAFTQDELKIASEEWPPYVYKGGEGTVGYSVEILEAVFAEMGVRFTITRYPWKIALEKAFSGEADALFNASKKPDRMEYCFYPSEHLMNSRYVLFIRKEDEGALKFDTFEDLKGHKVGVTAEYSYTEEFWNFLREHDLILREMPTDQSNFELLTQKLVDYFPAELLNGIFLIKQMGLQGQITYIDKTLVEKPYYIIFNKTKVPESFVEQFSQELAKFKQTDQFKAIEEKYLK